MEIRKTLSSDIAGVMEIYDGARVFMASVGNPGQWINGYPSRESVEADIAEGCSYVVTEGDELLAVFYFRKGEDPTYRLIYGGEWLNSEPYAVIHRIAVGKRGCGIGSYIIDWCLGFCDNLRIDTHEDNKPMQALLLKNGFRCCGIIYLASGAPRLAYHRIK